MFLKDKRVKDEIKENIEDRGLRVHSMFEI